MIASSTMVSFIVQQFILFCILFGWRLHLLGLLQHYIYLVFPLWYHSNECLLLFLLALYVLAQAGLAHRPNIDEVHNAFDQEHRDDSLEWVAGQGVNDALGDRVAWKDFSQMILEAMLRFNRTAKPCFVSLPLKVFEIEYHQEDSGSQPNH